MLRRAGRGGPPDPVPAVAGYSEGRTSAGTNRRVTRTRRKMGGRVHSAVVLSLQFAPRWGSLSPLGGTVTNRGVRAPRGGGTWACVGTWACGSWRSDLGKLQSLKESPSPFLLQGWLSLFKCSGCPAVTQARPSQGSAMNCLCEERFPRERPWHEDVFK